MAIEKCQMTLDACNRVKGGLKIVGDGVDDGEYIVVRAYTAAKGADISKDASLVLIDEVKSDPMPKPATGKKWAFHARLWCEQESV